jgi:hypothetical protein
LIRATVSTDNIAIVALFGRGYVFIAAFSKFTFRRTLGAAIAIFTDIADSIAADLFHTLCRAVVPRVGIAVIALLAGFDGVIAADRRFTAKGRCSVITKIAACFTNPVCPED